jgi:hypothetical protein
MDEAFLHTIEVVSHMGWPGTVVACTLIGCATWVLVTLIKRWL